MCEKNGSVAGTLTNLAHDVHLTAVSKGWYEGDSNFAEKIALAHSELSEALEEYRSGNAPDHMYHSSTPDGFLKPEGVPIELADCIIRILDLSSWLGIDIGEAVRQKMEFNLTRDYRHGGKVC